MLQMNRNSKPDAKGLDGEIVSWRVSTNGHTTVREVPRPPGFENLSPASSSSILQDAARARGRVRFVFAWLELRMQACRCWAQASPQQQCGDHNPSGRSGRPPASTLAHGLAVMCPTLARWPQGLRKHLRKIQIKDPRARAS